MPSGFEPAPEVKARRVRRVGASEAAGDEAEPFGLAPYCFFKPLAVIHPDALTPFGLSLSKACP